MKKLFTLLAALMLMAISAGAAVVCSTNDDSDVVEPTLPDNVIYSSLIDGCPDWTSQTVYSDDEIDSVWE